MGTSIERSEFQADVKQLLDLMVHSLYSDKDIFLRELISNGSDALDKLRFEQLTRPELRATEELHIQIETTSDGGKRTVSVIDNGIGMSREEVVSNIGTIARSGTKEFLSAIKESAQKEIPPQLIGQFGVGFYSSFMIAEKVEVLTRRAGEETATHWESMGDGSYGISESTREQFGTTVTLHLKPEEPDHGIPDYTKDSVLKGIVKKYSDFVSYPIKMKKWRAKDGTSSGAMVLEEETLNSMKAIWSRAKNEVTEGEYREFYRHIAHDWSEPLRHIPMRIEGNFEAHALLYIPSRAPWDLFSPEMKRGVQLYVKRVFIMDECKELMPSHLRFIRGVVDAHDLSLNVSREILQKDRQIHIIRKQLVKKVLSTLEEMKKDARPEYLGFWTQFGQVMKEGLVQAEDPDKGKILDLMLVNSTFDETTPTTLADYVGRMKADQDAIHFLTGPSAETVRRSPLLESFKAKGYEVLLFADPIDEIWLERAPTFQEKNFRSISKGDVELGSAEDRKQQQKEIEEKGREYKDLLTCLRVHLQDDVKEVRISNRMTTSAVCLVQDKDDVGPQMMRILEHMGQDVPVRKWILELNPSHPILPKLQALFAENRADGRLKEYAELLFGQAVLAESGHLKAPAEFARLVADLMVRAA